MRIEHDCGGTIIDREGEIFCTRCGFYKIKARIPARMALVAGHWVATGGKE